VRQQRPWRPLSLAPADLLLRAVCLNVMLGRFLAVFHRVDVMAVRQVGMVRRSFVIA
jgi:hypothetical protein